jgi:Gas vesicle synthesis protein GvpL/GvpF
LASLLYCVTPNHAEPISGLAGVADQPIVALEASDMRVYWSEIANPETLLEPPVRVPAEQKYRQVLKEVALRGTALSCPFPVVVPDIEAIDSLVAQHREYYARAFDRLADTIEYQLTATWEERERTDLATPVSGREYVKRREEAEARVAAIDSKLKTVTAGIVRDWRSRHDRRKHVWYALVHRDDRDRFVAALRSAGPSEGVRLRLGGPWPPNEFVESGNRAE